MHSPKWRKTIVRPGRLIRKSTVSGVTMFFLGPLVFQIHNALSDLGGQVGLWLGMSVIAAIELLELLFDLCWHFTGPGKSEAQRKKEAAAAAELARQAEARRYQPRPYPLIAMPILVGQPPMVGQPTMVQKRK